MTYEMSNIRKQLNDFRSVVHKGYVEVDAESSPEELLEGTEFRLNVIEGWINELRRKMKKEGYLNHKRYMVLDKASQLMEEAVDQSSWSKNIFSAPYGWED